MSHLDEDLDAGQTAVSYADDFVDAAVAKLDGLFGKGYAKANPQALAGYVTACAANLNAFMVASSGLPDDLGEMLSAFDEATRLLPEKPKSKRGR